MKKISILVFAFTISAGSIVFAFAPRDAGSKIRGEAYYGTSDAINKSRSRGNSRPAQAPQQSYVRTAPQAPADATATNDHSATGTRTLSVEPQTPARTQTYRAYAPQRRGLLGWLFGN